MKMSSSTFEHAKFALKKLDKSKYFFDIKVKCQTNGFLLMTQTKYTRDILYRINIVGTNGVHSPMIGHRKASKFRYNDMHNPFL